MDNFISKLSGTQQTGDDTFTMKNLLDAMESVDPFLHHPPTEESNLTSATREEHFLMHSSTNWPNPVTGLPLSRFNIIEDVNMTTEKQTEVTRTLKERFFTLPWHPFKKTKMITIHVPSEDFIRYGTTFICHPLIAARIRKELMK